MAADNADLEHRLQTVELGLRAVQEKLEMVRPGTNWVEQVSGSLADIPEEDYQRFLEHCRAVRAATVSAAAEEAGQ